MRNSSEGKIAWAIEDIGGRGKLEDAHFIILNFQGNPKKIFGGIFDGHGGKWVAELAAKRFPVVFRKFLDSGLTDKQALESTFLTVDQESIGMRSGAVAVVIYLDDKKLTFANAGDAELLLVSKSGHKKLTELHRLSNETERMRVIDCGGGIWGPYVTLPDGYGLMCTRSLGDHAFRDVGIIPNPFIGTVNLTPQDKWLIAACDGLWDVMLPVEVATIARKMLTAKALAEALRHEALIVRRTNDNLTIIAIQLSLKE